MVRTMSSTSSSAMTSRRIVGATVHLSKDNDVQVGPKGQMCETRRTPSTTVKVGAVRRSRMSEASAALNPAVS